MTSAMALTTHDAAAAPHRAAAALHPLLDLIRAAPFGSSRSLWTDAVIRPLQARRLEGAWVLRRTLLRLVVRASKAELGLLPPLIRRAVRVPFAPSHARSFNQLANLVRLNLLLADWNDPDHQESLLHADRAVYARELYLNVRKACCVAGAVKIAPTEVDLCEMMTLLCRRRGLPKPDAWDYDLHVDGDGDGGEGGKGNGSGSGATVGGDGGVADAVAKGGFHANTVLGKNVATLASTAAAEASAGASSKQVSGIGDERMRRTEGERGRRAGAHLPGGLVSGSIPPWLPETHPLAGIEDAMRHGGPCGACGCYVRISLAPPCGCCVLCPSCAEASPRRCAKCNTPYAMQAVDDPDRRAFNDDPKWPVPHELIEWQPAFVGFGAEGHRGGHWSADWRSTDSSKVTWLIERLRLAGAAPPPPPVGYTAADRDADVASGGELEADAWRLRDAHDDDGGGIARVVTAEGLEWTGAANGFSRYEDGHVRDGAGSVAAADADAAAAAVAPSCDPIQTRAPPKPPPGWSASRKAVVYSAFWEHIQLIQMHLARRGVPFALMLRHEKAQSKAAELERFRFDPACGVLLMDTSGVVGLDLSFASLVIAMEPVPDASVLAQLEARAHRMGQCRPVEVEVLAMEGCAAEEAMLATVDPALAAKLTAAAMDKQSEDSTGASQGASKTRPPPFLKGGETDTSSGSARLSEKSAAPAAAADHHHHRRHQWGDGMEENVDAERARHKQCLALVRAVNVSTS